MAPSLAWRKKLKELHNTAFKVKELIILTCTCQSQDTFLFQGHFYKQFEGLAMVSPLSSVLIDIYMHYLENNLFGKISFRFGTRYIDDTYTLFDTSLHKIHYILQIINSINNNIQFTYEIENNSVLPFFDTLVSRQTSQHLCIVKNFLFPYLHVLVLTNPPR